MLVLIRGIPGSGKSTLVRQVAPHLPGATTVLDPDDVDVNSDAFFSARARFTADGIRDEIHVYRYLCELAQRALTSRRTVLWNQPFTSRPIFRHLLRAVLGELFDIPAVIVELEADSHDALYRLRQRIRDGGHGSESTFQTYVNDYETFGDLGYPTYRLRVPRTGPSPADAAKLAALISHSASRPHRGPTRSP